MVASDFSLLKWPVELEDFQAMAMSKQEKKHLHWYSSNGCAIPPKLMLGQHYPTNIWQEP